MNEEQFNNENAGSREAFSQSNHESQNSSRHRFTNFSKPENRGTYRNSGNYRSSDYNRGEYQPRYSNQGNYRRNYNNSENGNYGYNSERTHNSRNFRNNFNGYDNNNSYNNNSHQPHTGFQPRRPYSDGYSRENRWNKQRDNFRNENFRNYGNSYAPRFNAQPQNDEEITYRKSPNFSHTYPQNNGSNRNGGYGFNRNRRPYSHGTKYNQKKRMDYKEVIHDPNEPVRLNKYLANAGVCSRRDADKYIAAGVVTVNGVVVTELGTKVLRSDNVQFHETPIKMEKKVYVLLNKPKGYVTTSEDPQNRKTVMDLVRNACPERIYPVGRLDRNTTGVLMLTNDGELASKLTHPKFLKKKIYHVVTDRNVSAADLHQIAEGIDLEDGPIKADAIEYASPTDKKQIGIEIHSGKNRIVRRIFEHLGYHVTKLDRVYFAGMTKKNVRRGDWRYLTEKEVDMLRMGAFE